MKNRTYTKIFRNKDTLLEMLEKYSKGKTISELGREYNCDHTSIVYHVQKNNVGRGKEVLLLEKEYKETFGVGYCKHCGMRLEGLHKEYPCKESQI